MKRGFTLVELLVVITVIGILAAVVVVNMSGGMDRANITKGQAFSEKIGGELAGSLVSEWRFDEGAGSTARDAWGANSGTLSDSSMWRSGGDCVSGNCLEFNGTSDYVDCGNDESLYIPSLLTIEAWIKLNNDYTSTQAIISNVQSNGGNSTYGLELGRTDNKFSFLHMGSIVATSALTISDNNWHHVVATQTGSSGDWDITFYLDGVFSNTDNTVIDPGLGGNTVIGRHGDYLGPQYFDGLIDEVRIYNNAADLTQVQSHYLAGLDRLLSNGAISKSEYNQRTKKLNQEMVIK